MQRMQVPAGHNDTTESFKRTLCDSSFLCTGSEAYAITVYKTSIARRAVWGVMKWGSIPLLIATACLLIAAAVSKTPVQTQAPAVNRVALSAQKACPGMHVNWVDDKTIECLKEAP